MNSTRLIKKNANAQNTSVFESKELSWKAKGIWAYLMAQPEGSPVTQEKIQSASTDGDSSVRAGIKELTNAGLLEINRIRSNDGSFIGQEWIVLGVMP